MEYDYNKPIAEWNFEILTYTETGKQKTVGFIYNNTYYRWIYKYGPQFGFSFMYEYPNKNVYENSLSMLGEKIIYSSTIERECTEFGKYLEYSFMKSKVLVKARETTINQ